MFNFKIPESFILLSSKIVPAFIGILTTPILTNLLSLKEYGSFTLLFTILTLIFTFSSSWVTSINIRFYPKFPSSNLDSFLNILFLYSIIVSIILWILYYIFYFKIGVFHFYIGILWILFNSLFDFLINKLRVRNSLLIYSIILSLKPLLSLILTFFLLIYYRNNFDIILISQIVVTAILSIFISTKIVNSNENESNSNINYQTLLKYGLPVAFSNIIIFLLSYADRFIIFRILGFEKLGIYSAIYDISEKSIFFINSLILLTTSINSFKIFENFGKIKTKKYLQNILNSYIIFIPLLILIFFLSENIILKYIFPKSYQEAFKLFPFISIGGLLVGIMHRFSIILSIYEKTTLIFKTTIIALLTNIVLNFLLIKWFNISGAVISTILSYFLWLILIKRESDKFLIIQFPYKIIIQIFSLCIIIYLIFINLILNLICNEIFKMLIILILVPILYLSYILTNKNLYIHFLNFKMLLN